MTLKTQDLATTTQKQSVSDWVNAQLQLCDDLLWRNGLIIASFGQEEENLN